MQEHTLLIVEDEVILRRMLSYKLSKSYEVLTAADGVEALALLDEQTPDLILCDVMMPNMDGFTFRKKVSVRPDTRSIPFIFLTAKSDDLSRKQGEALSVDAYITKPFDVDNILERIRGILNRVESIRQNIQHAKPREFHIPMGYIGRGAALLRTFGDTLLDRYADRAVNVRLIQEGTHMSLVVESMEGELLERFDHDLAES